MSEEQALKYIETSFIPLPQPVDDKGIKLNHFKCVINKNTQKLKMQFPS